MGKATSSRLSSRAYKLCPLLYPRKEARAGCGLKNQLREFFLTFAYVKFMVFRVYLCEKSHTSPSS